MAIRYYDDILIKKIQRWLPEASKVRVLRPDETSKFFSLTADDLKDQAFQLPLVALSRKPDLELLSTVKSPKSYDGLKLGTTPAFGGQVPAKTAQMNVLPIRPEYQLDIYAKTAEECEEYVRGFLFKLINNPAIIIDVPYNDSHIEHIANIRVLSNISDTSAITERIFSGQFTRWTIPFELQDAFLFSIPYRKNWILHVDEDAEMIIDNLPTDKSNPNSPKASALELVEHLEAEDAEAEHLDIVITTT
jgi:hypothetical protein